MIVDDDPHLRRVLKIALSGEGYEVKDVRSGEDAELALRESRYDLMLLDMNMPGMGGYQTCRTVRATSDIVIVMLTVRNSEDDKIAALDAGADDFVTKPFSTPELMARVRAALRRAPMVPETGRDTVALGDTVIDFQGRKVTSHGQETRLTPKEFDLLRYLFLHPNRAIPHRELLQAVWGPDYGDETEYLRVFVKQLRRKLESDPAKPKYLLTEPWVGYRLALESAG